MPWNRTHPKPKAGDPISARPLRMMAETCDWASRIRVTAPLEMTTFGGGPLIRINLPLLGVFFCNPGSVIAAASGSWPTLTAGSLASVAIYQAQGANLVAIAGTSTVFNWYPTATEASKVLMVAPDGFGNYVVVAQSCT